MKPGRNDACICGSGNKYKNCCADKEPQANKTLAIAVGAIVLLGGAAIVSNGFRGKAAPATQSTASAPAAPVGIPAAPAAPAPAAANTVAPAPGPAPEGKVWSPEHKHWHDAPKPGDAADSQIKIEPQKVQAGEKPMFKQPDGPVPAGKVWSAEHGHWHDAATGKGEAPKIVFNEPDTSKAMLSPDGTMIWSPEHKHWHKREGVAPASTAPGQPRISVTTTPTTTPPTK